MVEWSAEPKYQFVRRSQLITSFHRGTMHENKLCNLATSVVGPLVNFSKLKIRNLGRTGHGRIMLIYGACRKDLNLTIRVGERRKRERGMTARWSLVRMGSFPLPNAFVISLCQKFSDGKNLPRPQIGTIICCICLDAIRKLRFYFPN